MTKTGVWTREEKERRKEKVNDVRIYSVQKFLEYFICLFIELKLFAINEKSHKL